jgi:hypothetical protein
VAKILSGIVTVCGRTSVAGDKDGPATGQSRKCNLDLVSGITALLQKAVDDLAVIRVRSQGSRFITRIMLGWY